ncbi:MAG: FGGY family carbohydrate kinase [Promethearchaeota archaeon]
MGILMEYYLVYDIGSRVVKCAIGDQAGNIISIKERQPRVLVSGDGFYKKHDVKSYWAMILDLTRETLSAAKIDMAKISKITCSSVRPSCVFLNDDDVPVYIGSNLDLRGIETAGALEEKLLNVANKNFHEISGHFPMLLYCPSRYQWFKENDSRSFRSIKYFMPLDSWVLFQLGGEEHVNEVSAAESGFFDVNRKEWFFEWTEILGMDEDFFLPIVKPGEVIGDLSEHVKEDLSLDSNIELVAGLPDTQAALLGAGCINDGELGFVFGSTGPVQQVQDRVFKDRYKKTWHTVISLKNVVDREIIETNIGIAGTIIDWIATLFYSNDDSFDNTFYEKIDQDFRMFDAKESEEEISPMDVYAFLGPYPFASTRTKIVPGMFFFPTLGAVDAEFTSRKQFISAAYENILFASMRNLEFIENLIGTVAKKIFLLGGMTRNELFTQRFADLLNRDVFTTSRKEATIQGLIECCLVADGLIKSTVDLEAHLTKQEMILQKKPRTKLHPILRERYDRWCSYLQKIDKF